VFGKPGQTLLAPVIKRYSPERMAIVGDRLYTDKKLANNVGIDFVCVLSGETKRVDLIRDDFGKYPELVIDDLGEISTSLTAEQLNL
jgi:ribonucleotide monophosphatase NagD (HAD superfamily)